MGAARHSFSARVLTAALAMAASGLVVLPSAHAQKAQPTVPSAPRSMGVGLSFGAAAPGEGRVLVGFDEPVSDGGARISEYLVSCNAPSASPVAFRTRQASGPDAPITVGELQTGVAYTCTAKAKNAVGTGPSSTPSAPVTVPAATVPSAPRSMGVGLSFGAAAAGEGRVLVGFDEPVSDGGSRISEYRVSCNAPSAEPVEFRTRQATGPDAPITVRELQTGVAYTCTAKAVNAVGTGPASAPSAPVTVPVLSVPSAPRSMGVGLSFGAAAPGEGRVLVGFDEPVSDGGSRILEYRVSCNAPSAEPAEFRTRQAVGPDAPITVGELQTGVAYTCTAKAVNAVGTGPASTPSAPVTVPSNSVPPSAPRAVVVVAGRPGLGAASVSFAAPATNGGVPVLDYLVSCNSPSASPAQFRVRQATGSGSPIEVGQLQAGVPYTCTVKARNAVGTGPASASSAPVTVAALSVPSAPLNVGVVSAGPAAPGAGLVFVSFDEPTSNGGSRILEYRVECNAPTASPVEFRTRRAVAGASVSFATVGGLQPGVPYRCTINAVNERGIGPVSVPSAPVTVALASVASAPRTVVVVAGRPGLGAASVGFAAPATNGGVPILEYLVSCNAPSASPAEFRVRQATGSGSPIEVAQLQAGVPYTCTVKARNAVGTGPASASSAPVTVAALSVPSAPLNVGVVSAGPAAPGAGLVFVSFDEPTSNGGSRILEYRVSCNAPTASPAEFRVRQATAAASVSFATVGQLQPGVPYTCTIKAVNELGTGPASAPSAPVTVVLISVPPSAPRDVVATAVGPAGPTDGQVGVRFEPPVSSGGSRILEYLVSCNAPAASPIEFRTRQATGQGAPMLVRALQSGVAYTCSVKAVNAVGTGPASASSAPVTVPVIGAPSVPRNVRLVPVGAAGLTDGQVVASFDVPVSDGGAPITVYGVVCGSSAAAPGFQSRIATGSGSPLTVGPLQAGVGYNCVVRARNAAGDSAAAGGAVTVPAIVAPSAPRNVRLVPVGAVVATEGQVVASFDVPVSDGGAPITVYGVVCGSSAAAPGFQSRIATGSGSPLTVGPLQAGVGYNCVVRARNAAGDSAAAGGAVTVPVIVAPSSPRNVRLVPVGAAGLTDGQVVASFDVPVSDGGAPITVYGVVCGSQAAAPGFQSRIATGSGSPLTVGPLQAGVGYNCVVRARNAAGDSAAAGGAVTVPAIVAPSAPRNVVATAVGPANRTDGQLRVTFDAPSDDGGAPIVEYRVTCRTTASALPGFSSRQVNGSGSPITVGPLQADVSYACEVKAVNQSGLEASAVAPPAVVPLIDPPTPPRSVVATPVGPADRTDGELVVTFDPPSDDGGAPIVEYRVTCRTTASALPGFSSRQVNGSGSPITVGPLQAELMYRCEVKAVNQSGLVSEPRFATEVFVPLIDPPTPPRSVVATPVGPADRTDGELVVRFDPPSDDGGAPIVEYRVTCRTTASALPGFSSRQVNGPGSPITVGPLQAELMYRCEVKAVNQSELVSEPRFATEVFVPLIDPPTPPRSVVATPVGPADRTDGELVVRFDPPSDDGGAPIVEYRVTCRAPNASLPEFRSRQVNGPGSPITVGSLEAGANYRCEVKAVNQSGLESSPRFSDARGVVIPFVTFPTSPRTVVATVDLDRLSVAFDVPGDDGGQPILSYAAECTSDGDGVAGSATGPASPLVVPALTPGVPYTCTVTAANSFLTGPPSARSPPVIPVGVPGPPGVISASAGPKVLTVGFTAPVSDGGSKITRYRARCRSANTAIAAIDAFGSTTPITLKTSVQPGTTYTCSVAAENLIGWGPASAQSDKVATPDVPAAPINVVAAALSSRTEATLSFQAPGTDGGAPVNGYRATCEPANGGTQTSASGLGSPIVLPLGLGEDFVCWVQARNAVGFSPVTADDKHDVNLPKPVVPGIPRDVSATVAPESLAVAFLAPASDGGAPIERYRVTCEGSDGSRAAGVGTGSPVAATGTFTPGAAYTCTVVAENMVGPGNASAPSAPVNMPNVPAAPRNPQVSAVPGRGELSVSFELPASDGGAPITGFRVGCVPQSGGAEVSAVGVSPVTVVSLVPGRAYGCEARATNGVGEGPASARTAAVEVSAIEPGAPAVLSVLPGVNTVTVQFAPPSSDGGALVTSYRVSCRGEQQPAGGASGVVSPIVVSGLEPATEYTCTAAAQNAAGVGPDSAPSAPATTFATPSPPLNVVAQAGVRRVALLFDPPASDGGAPVTRYRATCTTPDGEDVQAGGDGSPLVVDQLASGTTYRCSVVAQNAVGDGSPASSEPVTTAGAPGPPTDVVVTVGGQTLVSFSPPADDGRLAIHEYQATCTSSTGATRQGIGAASPVVVDGLTPGATYRCTVRARNAVAASQKSIASAEFEAPDLPGAPVGVTALPLVQGAEIRFSPPADDGGAPVTNYVVLCLPENSRFDATPSASGVTSPISVFGLVLPRYSCSVRAENAAGLGPASDGVGVVLPRGTLVVTKNGTGGGDVGSTPGAIRCGSACFESYVAGTSVTLSAFPDATSTFAGWGGACSGAGSCVVSVDQYSTVTATFTRLMFMLTVSTPGGGGSVSDSGPGINCEPDCSEAYEAGLSVRLSATPAAGLSFGSWTGCDPGTSCVVTMNAARSVTATFRAPLTVTKSGTGGGTVTSSPAGISCGASCSQSYAVGTTATLTATPDATSTFAGWGGACSGAGACVVLMDQVRNVTATFNSGAFLLTVAKNGTGGGSVSSSPAGVTCGADCSESYVAGTVVALTATPDATSTFAGWGGACSGVGACVVSMDAAKSVSATFTRITYALSVARDGTGGGSVSSSPAGISCGADCSESYAAGTVVTLTATPDATSTFAGWSGAGCSGAGTCVVTMDAAKSVTATFTRITFLLTVAMDGTGGGSVSSSPAGITCGGDCSEIYTAGTVVTLTATPDATSTFTGWSAPCSVASTCVVTMDAARSVTATFTLSTFALTVARDGTGGGSVASSPPGISCGMECSEIYDAGTVVTLTATPDATSTFTGWSDAGCPGTGTCVVTMNAATSVTATFTHNAVSTFALTVVRPGGGGGSVTSDPVGITCPPDCSEDYASGTFVQLEFTPDPGATYAFEGCSYTSGSSCGLTMNADATVTAHFDYRLTVAKDGTGTGTVTSTGGSPFIPGFAVNCGGDCSVEYEFGSSVTLTATPDSPSTFTGWTGGGCSGGGTCVVTMDQVQNVTATFTAGTGAAPDAPTNVTASITGFNTISVDFTPGSDGGSPITGFEVTCYATSSPLPSGTNSGSSSPIVVTIGSFSGGFDGYKCFVVASNVVGASSQSADSNEVTFFPPAA